MDKKELLKEKECQTCFVPKSFMLLNHAQNYLCISTCISYRETITHVYTSSVKKKWKDGVLLVIIPIVNLSFWRFFCISGEAIFKISDLRGPDLIAMSLARTYYTNMKTDFPKLWTVRCR